MLGVAFTLMLGLLANRLAAALADAAPLFYVFVYALPGVKDVPPGPAMMMGGRAQACR